MKIVMKKSWFLLNLIIACMQLNSCEQWEKPGTKNFNDDVEIEYDGDIQTDTLAALAGYYSSVTDLPEDGRIKINFFIYQEESHSYGYVNLLRHERIEGQQDPEDFQVRLLAELWEEQDTIQAVCVEDFSEFSHKNQFGDYHKRDLLFRLELAGDELEVSWEKFFIDGLKEINFFPKEECLSAELISQRDVEIFLRARGVEDKKIFSYQENEAGFGDYLEVYYDIEKERGAGVYCAQDADGFQSCSGFDIASCGHEKWEDHRFDVIHDGTDLSEEYEVEKEYHEQGQIKNMEVRGEITGREDVPYEDTIALVGYRYREDGTLEQKECYFNEHVFGTAESSQTFYYDRRERLESVYSYVTHGCLRTFYFYEGENPQPTYRIVLDFYGETVSADSFVRFDYE